MKRRYRFLRAIGCGWFTSAFIVLINELSDLPPHKVGFMTWVHDMREDGF